MREAIKLAIEKGGYKDYMNNAESAIAIATLNKEKTVLDPEFWKSVAKALGWSGIIQQTTNGYDTSMPMWMFEAQRYFQKVFTDNDTEEFWSDLLK